MPLIPEHLIDEIQARVDIAEIIGRYVPLKRAGRHFKANCPFHKERTPSFMVNADKQIFHCFGCGVGGNIFSFLMRHDRLTFPEAVQQVAEQVGVTLPTASERGPKEQDALAPILEKAAGYFERMLGDAQHGSGARAYVRGRGLSPAGQKRFRVGLAPAGWRHLIQAAEASQVTPQQLEAAGLAIKGQAGPYDRFRNRLMFPIMDVRGRIIGFGGRSLGGEEPKYLNSPETALYIKGRHLFGLAQAKEAIASEKTAVLVEGYFDCAILADGGVPNVVSPLGTALTPEQARLLKRYAEEVVLAFDADAAGEQATLRGIDVLIESGLRARIARLPEGKDPDEVLRAQGEEGFKRLLAQASPVLDFLVAAARRKFPKTSSEGRVQAARFVLPTIARVPDAMLRSEYVQQLARELKLDAGAVAEELEKADRRQAAPATRAAARPSTVAPDAASGPERVLVALVLDDAARWEAANGGLAPDALTSGALQRIVAAIALVRERTAQGPIAAQVISRLEEPGDVELVTQLSEYAQTITAKDAALRECLRRLHSRASTRELAALREQMRAAEQSGLDDELQRILQTYQDRLVTLKGG